MSSVLRSLVLLGAAWCSAAAWSAEPAASTPRAQQPAPAARPPHAPQGPFATVGDTVITGVEYQRALAVAMRKKYYHAKPPEDEYNKFQREVGDDVVNRVLLLAEAKRRGVKPDQEMIKSTIAGYDAQYKNSPNWQANREKMLANVVPQLEKESILSRFEQLIRKVPAPTEEAARAYYEQHKDLFVEPEQVKLSVILLKVDPSSAQSVWDSAYAEAKAIHKKLVGGADFGELARLHSGDSSAKDGGQMEYAHRGMLPETVHVVVDKLQPGQLSEPVQLLEGIAIIKLNGRRNAQQRPYDLVKTRVADLWQRDEGEQRWKKLVAELRKGTAIHVDESHYVPLRGTSERPRSS